MKGNDYPRNALHPGYILLWYKIEQVLGVGGFGITYLAHDANLDKKVAIKEYLPEEMYSRNDDNTISPKINSLKDFEAGLNRFIREARTIAKFEHPNIVTVANVFEENNTAYMAMAYEKGKDLKQLLSSKKTLDEDHLLSIILPIMEGLEYVHDAGFIHRDIKPANIMIRQNGSPVLIDFGSALNTKNLQATVTTLVSPGFTPHEQYVDTPELQGPWTDIYSLGATIYRCICGVNPVDAITRSSSIIKRNGDPLLAAVIIGKGRYSESLLMAIDHALAFNEKDRPQNIREWQNEMVGVRLIDKEDTLYVGRFPNSDIRDHKAKSDRTLEFKPTLKLASVFASNYLIIACIAILAFATGTTIYSMNKEKIDDIVLNSPLENTISINVINKTTSRASDANIAIDTNKPDLPLTASEPENIIDGEITDTLSDGSSAPVLVIIPQGNNIIGSNKNEEGHRIDEEPQILITIKEKIGIGKTEVTIAEFKKFVIATDYLTEAELDIHKGCRTFQQGWGWTSGKSWL